MIKQELSSEALSNFNLKNVAMDLVHKATPAEYAAISLKDLEALRTGLRAVPASKHGLETICGASCETGAQ